MHERGQHEAGGYGATPFGRRPADAPFRAAQPATPVDEGPREAAPRTGLVPWAVRTAAVAGFVALFAAQYLARVSGPGDAPASRVILAAGAPRAEPETTGSIGGSAGAQARGTRLDPCALAATARPRP